MIATIENAVLAAVSALTVALPLAEIALRATLGVGIEGVAALVQHLTLALGMLGAAVTARGAAGRLAAWSRCSTPSSAACAGGRRS